MAVELAALAIDRPDAFARRTLEKEQPEGSSFGRFTVYPLPRGFGVTLGNAMRRTILSSIVGWCITYVKIDGMAHEYMAMDGVLEDSIELLLNIRRVKVRLHGKESSQTLRLSANGERVVTAADFLSNPEVEIINPNQTICTLTSKDSRFNLEAVVTTGVGYKMASQLKRKEAPIGVITLDCNYSPVERVAYEVENTRVGSETDYDKLVLSIETDGTKSADAVMGEGAAELQRYFSWLEEQQKNLMVNVPSEGPFDAELKAKFGMNVEELGLSSRAANCLRNANVKTVGELLEYSADQLMSFKNFGEKSLVEIVDRLAQMDLYLKEAE